MPKMLSKLGAVLMVAMIVAWVGSWVPLASAASKKAPAPVPQTGQTQCFNASGAPITCTGTGQDGEIQPGVAWPTPRFTDNHNGTVTDNLTGLIWLQNPFCSTLSPVDWLTAFAHAQSLAQGQCGLTDGSKAGDWRVPTVKELLSLIDDEFAFPALANAAGTGQATDGNPFALDNLGTGSGDFWSSTTSVSHPSEVWVLEVDIGAIAEFPKEGILSYLWPVRGSQ